MGDEKFPALAAYVNRATYLLAIGRPAARIAVYVPTGSMWLGDDEARSATSSLLAVARGFLETQRDFDLVGEEAFTSVLTSKGDALENLSGQAYRAVVVPSSIAISKAALGRLRTFAAAGGQVVFIGRQPSLVVDRSFLSATVQPLDLSWAVRESSGDLTPPVLAALPRPDVALDQPCPAVKCLHRRWRDADLYFFFNEGDDRQSRRASLAGHGEVQVWDAATGKIEALAGAAAERGFVSVPLELEPHATKFILVGPQPPRAPASRE